MSKFLITCNPEEDVDFLNKTEAVITFPGDLGPNDSGWCDAVTGLRILLPGQEIELETENQELKSFIRLKFYGRIEEIRGVEQSGSSPGS